MKSLDCVIIYIYTYILSLSIYNNNTIDNIFLLSERMTVEKICNYHLSYDILILSYIKYACSCVKVFCVKLHYIERIPKLCIYEYIIRETRISVKIKKIKNTRA